MFAALTAAASAKAPEPKKCGEIAVEATPVKDNIKSFLTTASCSVAGISSPTQFIDQYIGIRLQDTTGPKKPSTTIEEDRSTEHGTLKVKAKISLSGTADQITYTDKVVEFVTRTGDNERIQHVDINWTLTKQKDSWRLDYRLVTHITQKWFEVDAAFVPLASGKFKERVTVSLAKLVADIKEAQQATIPKKPATPI